MLAIRRMSANWWLGLRPPHLVAPSPGRSQRGKAPFSAVLLTGFLARESKREGKSLPAEKRMLSRAPVLETDLNLILLCILRTHGVAVPPTLPCTCLHCFTIPDPGHGVAASQDRGWLGSWPSPSSPCLLCSSNPAADRPGEDLTQGWPQRAALSGEQGDPLGNHGRAFKPIAAAIPCRNHRTLSPEAGHCLPSPDTQPQGRALPSQGRESKAATVTPAGFGSGFSKLGTSLQMTKPFSIFQRLWRSGALPRLFWGRGTLGLQSQHLQSK